MSQLWQMLARNYARFDTPLRPNAETLHAMKGLVKGADPLVVVLGGTPLFGQLAPRVWFVDVAEDALRLAELGPQQRAIHKNWLAAGAELAEADLIVGDGSMNAVGTPDAALELLRLLARSLKRGATLALRTFVKHELKAGAYQTQLASAFEHARFSEARFLVYGSIADDNGRTTVAEVDRYIDALGTHLRVPRSASDAYKAAYFAWRGAPAGPASAIGTQMYIPSRAQFVAQLKAAGLRTVTVSAGTFALAEFTPIYVARG